MSIMSREVEVPFAPFVVTVLSGLVVIMACLISIDSTPPAACICGTARNGAELLAGHLPGCPSGPSTRYQEFRTRAPQ